MTEKNYNPEQNDNKAMKKQEKANIAGPSSNSLHEKKSEKEKIPEKNEEKVKKKQIKIKKDVANLNVSGLHMSPKTARDLCKFVRWKKIEIALKELNEILEFKRALPMRGEFPHRKGNNIMAGRYPQNATKLFVGLIKSLESNSIANGIEEPIISEAIANIGAEPYARFGKWKRKRANIKLKATEKNKLAKTGGLS